MNWMHMIVITAVCIVLSALFSGTETGLMSVSRIRLRRLGRSGEDRAARLSGMLRRVEDPILSCLIGTNLFNVLASAVVTAAMVEKFGSRGDAVAVMVMAPIVIIFAEILPKMLFREYPEKLTLAVTPLLRGAMLLMAPLRWALLSFSTLLHRVLPGDPPPEHGVIDRSNLVSLLLTHAAGSRDRHFSEHLERCLELADLSLTGIMTPGARVVSLPVDATLAECLDVAAGSGYSRLPVREPDGSLSGWVLVRDLLLVDRDPGPGVPRDLLRDCLFADQDMSPWALLDEMRWQQQQMAVVVDRGGAPRGVVTLEDLLEVLVGRIEDEHDRPVGRAAVNAIGGGLASGRSMT